jgi:dihydroxyacetone kinase
MTTKTQDEATGLEDLDPATTPARDATHFRAIVAAAEAEKAADEALRARVREAREAGDSWVVIGAALGVTKQAAQQRFSRR